MLSHGGEVDLTATQGSVDINAGDNITLDAADDISLTTTSADGLITLHSAHTAGQAILIDANDNAASLLDIDAGILEIDTQGTFSVDGVGASNVTTKGALTLSGSTAVTVASHGGTVSLLSTQGGISVGSTEDASSNAIDIAATAGGIDITAAGGVSKGINLNAGGTSLLDLNTTAAGGINFGAVLTNLAQVSMLNLPTWFENSGSNAGNGTTTSFATNANAVPASIRVFLNGVRQEIKAGATNNDYSLGASNAVVMTSAPVTGDVVLIEWRQGQS